MSLNLDTQLLAQIPESPGVYRFYDDQNHLIYVGQSSNLRARLRSYRVRSRKKAHRKRKKILKLAARLEFETCPTPLSAKLKEDEWIKAFRPLLNTEGAYFHSYPFLGLEYNPSSRQLRWLLTRRRRPGPIYFGAFRNRETIEMVFLALASLLEWAGKSIGPKNHSRKYAHISQDVYEALISFFQTANTESLLPLSLTLLERPRARLSKIQVSEHFQTLRQFSEHELQEHLKALPFSSPNATVLEPNERDAAFILMRAKPAP